MRILYAHIIGSSICIGTFLYFLNLEVVNVAFNEGKYEVVKFDDSDEGGLTESSVNNSDSSFCYRYTLKKGVQFPYAGAIVRPPKFFDLETSNLITFDVESDREKRIFVLIAIANTKGKDMRFRRGVNILKGKHSYTVNQDELVVPEWFYESREVMEEDLKYVDFSLVQSIAFVNDAYVKENEPDEICIDNFALKADNSNNWLFSSIALVLFNLILIPFHKKKVVLEYQPAAIATLTPEELNENDANLIIEFINQNYTNPELSLKLIKKETRVHENRITQLIKSKCGVAYKDYVAQLRIEEAKRLLSSKDRTISEVGFAVGFNSTVTFNRVFKQNTNRTPSEFIESSNS